MLFGGLVFLSLSSFFFSRLAIVCVILDVCSVLMTEFVQEGNEGSDDHTEDPYMCRHKRIESILTWRQFVNNPRDIDVCI